MSSQKYACWNDFHRLFAHLRSDLLTGPFFGLTYDTPMFVPTPFMRYYCGVQVPHGFGPKPKDAFEITLPGGRIATCEARCTADGRSEEHTSELQSLMRISYAVFCLKKKKQTQL